MSNPGDPGRRLEWVEGPAEAIVTKAVELIGEHVHDARAFELRYEAVDRDLAEDEEPHPDEPVRWIASATVRRKYGKGRPIEHTYTGTSVVEPHGRHDEGIVRAVVELLEALGANVVAIFGDTPA